MDDGSSFPRRRGSAHVSHTIHVGGCVARPQALTRELLGGFPQLTLHTVSKIASYRGFLGIFDYQGVPLQVIIEQAGLVYDLHRQQRLFVVVHGADGFYATFSWGELFNRQGGAQVIVALRSRLVRDEHNLLVQEDEFRTLRPSWGGAFRLVVPGDDKYPDMRSIKWIRQILVCDGAMAFNQSEGSAAPLQSAVHGLS